LDKRDYERYLKRVAQVKKKFPFNLYSYCLMPNHVHLLLEVKKVPLSKIMQALQTGQTMFFNKKYAHLGHVFEGRYFWLLVEKDPYFLELIRYINLNPVRAGLVDEAEEWEYSSYREIVGLKERELVEREEILSNFSQDQVKAVEEFKDFIKGGLEVTQDDLFGNVGRGQFLGSNKFIARVESRMIKVIGDQREL